MCLLRNVCRNGREPPYVQEHSEFRQTLSASKPKQKQRKKNRANNSLPLSKYPPTFLGLLSFNKQEPFETVILQRRKSRRRKEMGSLAATPFLPSKLRPSFFDHHGSSFLYRIRQPKKKNLSISPVARLFGPAIFEASKLKVLFLGVDQEKHPGKFPRAYTLTHSDITSKLTLAISHTINNSQLQGWYNRLQRDEVVAEWKKVKGKMSLHVHCHISGGHFLLDLVAKLRYFIFCKELPVVLRAFVHGDGNLLNQYPELQKALVWVYFHSNIPKFNKVECWGPLKDAATHHAIKEVEHQSSKVRNIPEPCRETCDCCFPLMSSIRSAALT